jgi:DNA-binding LytR/AlgR family response regulator
VTAKDLQRSDDYQFFDSKCPAREEECLMNGENIIKIAILDDEKMEIMRLERLLKAYEAAHSIISFEIKTYSDSAVFLDEVDSSKFDIFFLDIYMIGATGIEVAEKIRKHNKSCEIIFNTSSDEFYRQAFKLQAVQYLEKPTEKDSLYACLDRILLERISYVVIQDGRKVIRMGRDDIIFCVSEDHYKRIAAGSQTYLVRNTMKDIENRIFGDEFYRVSTRLIVNLRHITEVKDDKMYMDDAGRSMFSIPHSRTSDLQNKWAKFSGT